ncbi:hypothetical protein [Sphingobacterium siyangense]|uniref:hypothetical protein n=1 Tax=Sphingobacterium siyangense TaxID=459529 RepID=UPI001965FC26|nr:hypothetical protein [Sphingobacterium siyangense]QRY57295.1 hypothetical protein JVX97_25425 [Sphingobacterium siyangense]
MKTKQIKLTNDTGEEVFLCLEPEGNIESLTKDEFTLIDLEGVGNPIIDIQIRKIKEKIYLSIWPENGNYEIK